MKNLLSKQ